MEARASERAEAAGSPCGTHAPWHPHGWVRRRRRRRRPWGPAGPSRRGADNTWARARARSRPQITSGMEKGAAIGRRSRQSHRAGRPRLAVVLVPCPSPPAPAPTFQAHECRSPRGARKVRSQVKGNSARRLFPGWEGPSWRRRSREHEWAGAKSVPLLLSRGLDLPQTWGVGAHAGQSRQGRRASSANAHSVLALMKLTHLGRRPGIR